MQHDQLTYIYVEVGYVLCDPKHLPICLSPTIEKQKHYKDQIFSVPPFSLTHSFGTHPKLSRITITMGCGSSKPAAKYETYGVTQSARPAKKDKR